VSAARLSVRLWRNADQGHHGAWAPRATRHPGFDPNVEINRQFSCVADRDHQYIGFGCRPHCVRKDPVSRQVAYLPGLVADIPLAD
jgi:hypothetical protein